MNPHLYTQEQKDDINERVSKALHSLAELRLNPSAWVTKENIGDDVFADRVTPYLKDLKYVLNEKGDAYQEVIPSTDASVLPTRP